MARRIRSITVTAIGTPPPSPLRPLVDEVLRALDQRRLLVGQAIDSTDEPRAPRDAAGTRRRRAQQVKDEESRAR